MNFFFKRIIKQFLNDRIVGRNIDVYESDIFLVSYPKSGNTWLRFLIGNIIHEDFNFGNMEELIPDIYVQNNKKLKRNTEKRILKSHEYFDPRYNKVVYIVRDPRSVFISYFEYLKKMKKININTTYSEFLPLFLKGKIDSYGTWSENLNSWLSTRNGSNRFLLVKYEDLKSETEFTLRKILNFMNVKFTEEKLKEAIVKSSFGNMKISEEKYKDKTKVLMKSDKNMSFVRKGEIDEWQIKLDSTILNKINNEFKNDLKRLGYD